jgi:hypothetical protein
LDDSTSAGAFSQVFSWLKAQCAFTQNDMSAFVLATIHFYSDGRGYLSQAWRELTNKLISLCEMRCPEYIPLFQQV